MRKDEWINQIIDTFYEPISENRIFAEELAKEYFEDAEKIFAKEYLDWLMANTVRSPYQAFTQFLKEKGIEVDE